MDTVSQRTFLRAKQSVTTYAQYVAATQDGRNRVS